MMLVIVAVATLLSMAMRNPQAGLDTLTRVSTRATYMLTKRDETASVPKVAASAPPAGAAETAKPSAPLTSGEHSALWGLLAQLVALILAVSSLYQATKALGVNPALLLAAVHDNMSLKTATAQNDFRSQFAKQFEELIKALPYRLVIVIDDLDRCRPSVVLDVMEAVNYLTSAGECFVIFGMATERVQAALGLAFKDIAAEMVDMEGKPQGDDADGLALAKRRAYAADYLQKLVNIEITVPTSKDMAAHRLLIAPEPVPRRKLLVALAELWRLWPLVVAVVAIALGFWFAGQLTSQQPTEAVVTKVAPSVLPPTGTPKLPEPPPEPLPKPSHVIETKTPIVQPGETVGMSSVLAWIALAFLPMLAVGGVIALRLLRKTIQETRDSPQFREALEIWSGVVAAKRATPRAIKRFGNRIRYLAMLQQGEAKDETPLDLLRARLLGWWRPGSKLVTAEKPAPEALTEYQLIAMGAIYEVKGVGWRKALLEGAAAEKALEESGAHTDWAPASYGFQITEAVQQHRKHFNVDWPPTEEEMAIFDRLLSGVRLAGDPVTVRPESHTEERSRAPDGMAGASQSSKTQDAR